MNQHIIYACGLLVGINLYGVIYAFLVTKYKLLNNKKIQTRNISYETFLSRLPLFTFNVLVLIFFNVIGIYFFEEYFIRDFISAPWMILEILFVLLIDDLFFYFLHRGMHQNKYIYKKIHKIHHRANTPIPLEYIYVHPLEWMSGIPGPFLGMVIIGGISFESYLIYLIIRNLHEIHIHSGIKSSKLHKIIPFYGTNEHHDTHHAKRDGNYASTFIFWDLLFKTKLK